MTKNKRLVYSTDPEVKPDEETKPSEPDTLPPGQQNLRLWRESRPGNKRVTIVRNFVGKTDDLEALAKIIKTSCGCGGSVKAGEILIQGDQREKVLGILTKLGYSAKTSGG